MNDAITTTIKFQIGNFLYPVEMTTVDGRIEFNFKYNPAIMDEVKSMAGAKWHGRDPQPRKIWSVYDCERNRFQIDWLCGGNPYEWFERPLQHWEYTRPLRDYQREMSDVGLTYHCQIWGAEMGLGKSLSAIEVMEKSGYDDWWWVGPIAALKAVERELRKWQSKITPVLMTYETLVKRVQQVGNVPPRGIILDEAQRAKTATTKRSIACFHVATSMRSTYGREGCYVIEMTGTPAPKSPVDWWHLCEIACPGYLREGSTQSFHRRLAFIEQVETLDGQKFPKMIGWKDDTRKCKHCGRYEDYAAHNKMLAMVENVPFHNYETSENEIDLLYERTKGLVTIKSKKNCLDLPDKIYRTIRCQPKPSMLRAARTVMQTAPNAMTAMTLLRELSDGFQYSEERDGDQPCKHCAATGAVQEWVDPNDETRTFSQTDFLDPGLVATLTERTVECPTCHGNKTVPNYTRVARVVPTPKAEVLADLLEENEDVGRIVIFAGFTGSVDRCVEIARKNKWTTIRVDGRGWEAVRADGTVIRRDPLDLWADLSDTDETRRVAFIAHPASGGVGLTLTEAAMVVYYSNDFNPEARAQSEDRIHRPGMDYARGATIVDLCHLPSDDRIIEILKDNRRLELMSMRELGDLTQTSGEYDYAA